MILKGRFEILKGYENNHVTIGFGSYGQVKLARDIQTNTTVAVKVVLIMIARSIRSPKMRC
jgi:serine/threonine protein kinase